jgi:hypothetical protein
LDELASQRTTMHIINGGLQFKFLVFIFARTLVNGGYIRQRTPTTAYMRALASIKFKKMTRLLIIMTVILPITAKTQELKKVKNQTLYDYEEYYVLKEDKKIKQGQYIKLTQFKKDTLVSGKYEVNTKNGNWRYFERGILIAQGTYNSDKKTGLWEYFENGSLITKYDYSENLLVYQSQTDYEYEILQENRTIKSKLERPPVYPHFYPLIYEKLTYPMTALRMAVFGKVLVSFVVNENGTTSDYKIENDIGADCGKEIPNVLKEFNKDWLPGILNAKPIATRVFVVGEFKLFDNGDKTVIVRKI